MYMGILFVNMCVCDACVSNGSGGQKKKLEPGTGVTEFLTKILMFFYHKYGHFCSLITICLCVFNFSLSYCVFNLK